MLVIIPSAGIGSRLDLHTKYFNKSMIQLGDTPVISKIIDSYPTKAEFIVITGYKGNHLKEYLALIYPNRKIKIINVKLFDGPGSGLTYSLRSSLRYIKKPFFFNANDTIFTDKNFFNNIKYDTMFLSKANCDTMKYATVEINNGNAKIHNKLNYLRKDYFNYTGVAYIKNINLFKNIIKNSSVNEGELSYFKNLDPNKINYKFVSGWYDIGSNETKENAEKFFSSKDKNILPKYDQGIFFKNKKVYKFFTNPETIKKRYYRSKKLYPHVPKVLFKKKYFYTYNFAQGEVFSKIRNKDKEFPKLLVWLNQKFWKRRKLNKTKELAFQQKCNSFYYEKSLSRINFLYEKNNLVDQKEKINKISVGKINSLFEKIDWKKVNSGVPAKFHGDLHFENIIINKKKNKITLLDWREDFSGLNSYGDIYYDLAKINHGLIIDHNIIKSSLYKINIQKKNITFNFFQSKTNKKCQKIFFDFIKLNGFSEKKVKILTSLIFLNIAGLHHYPYSIFLYYLGKLSLNNAINKK